MAFRERIEAILQVKDLSRFKGGMKSAADSVKKFGTQGEKTAASLEILKSIEEKLGRQTEILTAQTELLQHAIKEEGEEAVSTATKNMILNKSLKNQGSILPTMLTRWSFWKDRLSLTRSEIMTTAITIGTYLAPALIAVGNSAVAAALGGGAVAAGGLSSLLFGMVSFMIIGKQMTDSVKKIQKAQDAYNLAVVQFGGGSKEAARQAAHLYAVIQTQGGQPMREAQQALEKFGKTFKGATGGTRVNLAEIMTAGLGQLTKIMPQLGQIINMMSLALKKALKKSFKTLGGPEMMSTFEVLGRLFQDAIGPGVNGVTNLFIVFGRILRAAAPWALKAAKAFERITGSWRKGTHDGMRVQNIIDNLVKHTISWINLGKQIARTFKILFLDSKEQGRGLVDEMTILVTKFNDWLQKVSDSGKIAGLFDQYIRSLHDLVWAIQNPVDAIRKWLPVMMDAISNAVASLAPKAAGLFIDAFMNSGAWARFLTVVFLLGKFGVFRALGRQVAAIFIEPFMAAFVTRFASMITFEAAAGGGIGTAMAAAGTAAGTLFGLAAQAAIIAAILIAAKEILAKDQTWHDFLFGKPKLTGGGLLGLLNKQSKDPKVPAPRTTNPQLRGPQVRTKAAGGLIPSGTLALVGEAGPELAMAGVGGTTISPLSASGTQTGSGMQPMSIPPISVSDFVPPINVSVQVERREIARAVADYQQYRQARRGQG